MKPSIASQSPLGCGSGAEHDMLSQTTDWVSLPVEEELEVDGEEAEAAPLPCTTSELLDLDILVNFLYFGGTKNITQEKRGERGKAKAKNGKNGRKTGWTRKATRNTPGAERSLHTYTHPTTTTTQILENLKHP